MEIVIHLVALKRAQQGEAALDAADHAHLRRCHGFDAAGCPLLDAETAGSLVAQLQSTPGSDEASDTLAGANVLALVVQVDTDLVNAGGPLLGVWASTHRAE